MKKLVLAAIGVASTIGAASAADLPSRRAPIIEPPVPILSWSGFYIGLNAGGTWAESNAVTVHTIPTFINTGAVSALGYGHYLAAVSGMNAVLGGNKNAGFIGGGQIGYNWQAGTSVVLGIEADIQGLANNNSGSAITQVTDAAALGFPSGPVTTTIVARQKVDYLGTVRARFGYLVTPTLLAYVTGGLAYGGVKAAVAIQGAETPAAGPNNGVWATGGTYSQTRFGYALGGGLEWMFLPNWSLKGEYLYYDLGRAGFGAGATAQTFPPSTPYWQALSYANFRTNGHIARAGVNYHFNFGGSAPVVARY